MKDFIDLGREEEFPFDPDDESDVKNRIDHPSLYIWDAPKELLGIPKEGEAIIRYKVTSKTERVTENEDGEDEEKSSIDIEVIAFKPIKKDKEKKVRVIELSDDEIVAKLKE